jgi:hypothetical protein
MGDTANSTPAQDRVVPGRTPPGQPLGFVELLRQSGLWPPPVDRPRHPGPTVTPFLVVPAGPGDSGTHPADRAVFSLAIEIIDSRSGSAVVNPVTGVTYTLHCRVNNLGGAAAYGGLTEFYVAQPTDFDNAAATPGATLPAKGYAGFVVMPGGSISVACPNPWTPTTNLESAGSILVQAYDPFTDTLIAPFNARTDRHIGRRDLRHDFSGTWDGFEHAILSAQPPGPPGVITGVIGFPVRLVITQNGLGIGVEIFEGPPIGPLTLQATVTGQIAGGQVSLDYSDVAATVHHWTLTKPEPSTLHVEHRTHPTQPGTFDTLNEGDLHKI